MKPSTFFGPVSFESSLMLRAQRLSTNEPPSGACADVAPPLAGEATCGPFVDAKTEELKAAHDVLAEFYAVRLAGALGRMPAERALLGLRRIRRLLAVPRRDGGTRRSTLALRPCSGAAARRRAGRFRAGMSARSQVLKPTRSGLAETPNSTSSSADNLCARSGSAMIMHSARPIGVPT
jgi:hypothetical protein